jgi:hypothetical protein
MSRHPFPPGRETMVDRIFQGIAAVLSILLLAAFILLIVELWP